MKWLLFYNTRSKSKEVETGNIISYTTYGYTEN